MKDARAEIDVVSVKRDESTSRGVITKHTCVEIESEPRRTDDYSCGTNIPDPRLDTIWLERDRRWQ